jgi:hypothetical protein
VRLAVGVAVVLAAVQVRAYDSHCGLGALGCPNGLAAARTRWGVAPNGGAVDPRAEHARLWLETLAVSGLPASLNADIELPVFTSDGEVLGLPSVRPVRTGAARRRLRVTSLAELTQLPDFSFTLWDWATGNEGCPPGPLNPDVCHEYFPHIGMLNSNHMLPQAQRFYDHYHRLALQRAAQCATVFDDLPAGHRDRFRPYVLACEKLALAIEAVGQHFLQDAWSMGHMWERWGGPEFGDFGPGPLGDRTLGAAIAAYTGIIHGARSMLGPGFDDPLCAPHPGVGYVDGSPAAPQERLGLGDVFLNDVLLPAADASDYGPQRRALFGCAVDGMRTVYQQSGQVHGAIGAPAAAAFDPGRRVTDASCWGQRATNQALAIGFGLHTGTHPTQEPLLEVYPGLADAGEENETFPAGVLAFAFATFAPAVGLPPFSEEQALRFARDAAAAATEAAAKGADPATALATDLASGGLPPIGGIRPNSRFARGGPSELPASYADPFLPWDLFEADPVLAERKLALHLTFADAHAADRCGELAESDLLEYRALAEQAVGGGDPALEDARCGQCEQMVMPHLRFGRPGDHDVRREAFCALVGPSDAPFVFTDEDPDTFTGDEDTSFDALRVAARRFCGCSVVVMTVTFPSTIAEGEDAPLRVQLVEEGTAGSEPVVGAAIELTVTGGTAAATTGTTDALGEFETTAGLAPSSTSITIEVVARDAPGGFVLARKTVSASLAIEEFAGLWRGRVTINVPGQTREPRCGSASVTALAGGGFHLVLCSDNFATCGANNANFSNCATVFEVDGTGAGFTGVMSDHTGACCRGCPGQNRQWELGCQISGSVVAGADGLPHLRASIDTFESACSPGLAETVLDLTPFGAAPGCGDCIVSGGEECEPPGTSTCQADCRRPPVVDD